MCKNKLNFNKFCKTGGDNVKTSAIDIAKWFIKNGYDKPINTKEGNMKLQKMLYFANLINIAKYETTLFDDDMIAFEYGTVIEDVRQKYYYHYNSFIEEAKDYDDEPNENQLYVLRMACDIFGNLSPYELSKINHYHKSWQRAYYRGVDGTYHHKERSIQSIDTILEYDIKKIKEMVESYEEEMNNTDIEQIEIENVIFFYNPKEIELNDEVIDYLHNYIDGEESSFTISYDEDAGLVVY